jgi:hypothetical protein
MCLDHIYQQAHFAMFEGRNFGLAPLTTVPGDQIAMFYGVDTPFIICRVPKSSDCLPIGSCYFSCEVARNWLEHEIMERKSDWITLI